MVFFKKSDVKEREVQIINEPKHEVIESEKVFTIKKNLSLFDVDTMQYLIENFPEMSVEIQKGLNNLTSILEDTINHIEDKSSEIVKKNRDFKVSQKYRDTSISIYGVVQNINNYIKWMQEEYENNTNKEEVDITPKLISVAEISADETTHEQPSEEKTDDIEVEIYKDFSLYEPKGFRLDNNRVLVENWDDLLVKTAAILTKQYKQNKYSNKILKEITPIEKKSTQNSFRDTVIDMLTEYKINLDEFKIIIKNK